MATLVQPDFEWKRRIIGLDAHDLSVCYQCGTCTAVCPISTADNPFPRKEMMWVQWGLKERALGNASIWLCHQCGTCNDGTARWRRCRGPALSTPTAPTPSLCAGRGCR